MKKHNNSEFNNEAFTEVEEYTEERSGKSPFMKELFEWLKTICFCLIFVFLIQKFIVEVNNVSGLSMFPTLNDNDRVLTEKISPRLDKLDREDIVTIDTGKMNVGVDHRIVKRIIAIPGDRVKLSEGYVFVNDEKLNESYINEQDSTFSNIFGLGEYEITLGPDEYFVLGDNRLHSSDSRQIGAVNRKYIVGRLVFTIWPLSSFGKTK